jgi:hypothetical protein
MLLLHGRGQVLAVCLTTWAKPICITSKCKVAKTAAALAGNNWVLHRPARDTKAHKEEVPVEALKHCIACGCEKPMTDFYAHKGAKDGRQSRCKVCWAARTNEWAAANPEKYKANVQGRVKRYVAKRLDDVRAAERARYHADPQTSRDKVREKKRNNPATYLANNRKREQLKRSAVPVWVNDDAIREIYRKAAEKTKLTGVVHHVDHIVPLRSKVVCGLHVQHNLAVVESSENLKKGNRFWPDMP